MQSISVQQLKARLDAGESVHLLDVREAFEHENFNIGGVLLPLGKIQQMQTDEVDGWKGEEVICYCRSGNRSGMACLVLETVGFTNVKNLAGGMNAWQDSFGA
jgi:rhodanese-related sulfurtransferase